MKTMVSGGGDEKDVIELMGWVDGFRIGTGVSARQVIDFCLKIVEVNETRIDGEEDR